MNDTLPVRNDFTSNEDQRCNIEPDNDSAKNTPLRNHNFTPLVLAAQGLVDRNYIPSEEMTDLAVDHYRTKKAKGLTWKYLIERGLVKHKTQAQDTLKYHVRKGTLFTLQDRRPQQYYPTAIKSEIMEKLQKNTPLDPTGVVISKLPISKANCLEPIVLQTLEDYVLPLLPKAPLFIHNMHFKIKITPECYAELDLSKYRRNAGKFTSSIIGNTAVDFVFYANGTVDIYTECSRHPFKLQKEEDRSRLLVFFGQLRGNLVNFLKDPQERIVPDIMDWQMTECDINKDVKISDLFHATGLKIQVKHADHLFRVYIKSMGPDTICRVEQQIKPRKEAVEAINDIFNPFERIEKRLTVIEQKIDAVAEEGTKKKSCANNSNNGVSTSSSLYNISSQNGKGDKSN